MFLGDVNAVHIAYLAGLIVGTGETFIYFRYQCDQSFGEIRDTAEQAVHSIGETGFGGLRAAY